MGNSAGNEQGAGGTDRAQGPLIRREIRFLLNDRAVRLAEVAPSDTLLGWLRGEARLTGTKEGCAEGDCGACTVLIGRLRDGKLTYRPVNACIRLLASVDLCHVVTVEHLSAEGLHPVQQAMIAEHGSQCGFCTPGVVMALAALRLEHPEPTRAQAVEALQGNLCRCTGYAPILRAAVGASGAEPLLASTEATSATLAEMADGARVEISRDGQRAVLPADLDDLLALRAVEPEATVVAGATDVGLWATKRLDPLAPAQFIGHLDALARIEVGETLSIGALVSYADLLPVIRARMPWAEAYWLRIGGAQVRAMGTIGGNIANGSPIGDTPPWLIALDAELVLASAAGERRMPLEAFFLDYGRQDLRPGEIVVRIEVPWPGKTDVLAVHKVSKRRDEDISAVAMGLCLRMEGEHVAEARIAFGGMAGVPKRATAAEAALTGRPFDWDAVEAACAALSRDFQPLTDWRASAEYRMAAAEGLLRRVWFEREGVPIRPGEEAGA